MDNQKVVNIAVLLLLTTNHFMRTLLLAIAALSTCVLTARGQDQSSDNHKVKFKIPEIALLDIESGGADKTVTLAIEAPTQAGKNVNLSNAVNNSLWLNYTSIVNKNSSSLDNTRKVTAKISEGSIPLGLDLKVQAGTASADGMGNKGSPVGSGIVLNSSDQDIITGIGSCYTGNGNGKGHQLSYSLELKNNGNDFNLLDNNLDNTEITITYTITDN